VHAASIVVSNWNGKNLLQKNLPSIIRAIKYSGTEHELIVVDDASSDGSQEFVRQTYPQVKLIGLKENKGFVRANNIAVGRSKHDIVILLNNDMLVEKDCLSFIIPHFDDEKVFAVTPKMITEDIFRNKYKITISCWSKFRCGFWHDVEIPGLKDKEGRWIVLTAPGGGIALDKKKFLSLGGFDILYYPFYYEDTDLSYRAWKRGWKIIYEPATVINHRCSMTIGGHFDRQYTSLIKMRNYYLFIWKNITDRRLILEHLAVLPFHLLAKVAGGRWIWVRGFFWALKELKAVLAHRKVAQEESILSDREILDYYKRQ
jgi:GT2 family glycosyltransferase